MDMIDCHVHVEALNQRDLELMAIAGIKAIVSHTSLPEVQENIPLQAIFDFGERMLGFHTWRVSKHLIDTYVCSCVSMVGVPTDYREALERLPQFLSRERVVGIGEVGLEPSSWTCPDLAIQEEILRAQLVMARDSTKTVAIHTPPTEKPKWVERYLAMMKELKLDPGKVVIDHADATVVKMITDSGCNAAITVQPWRKVRAADAAKAIQDADLHRVLVDSDCSLLESDPLAVPRTALEMRKLGMTDGDIKTVVWDNPRRVYGLD